MRPSLVPAVTSTCWLSAHRAVRPTQLLSHQLCVRRGQACVVYRWPGDWTTFNLCFAAVAAGELKGELVEQENPMYISVGAIILILVIVAIVLVMRGRRI